jgi:hypothetical protein
MAIMDQRINNIVQFPPRGPFCIRILEDEETGCWLVLTHRGHGWLHTDLFDVCEEALALAAGFGVAVQVSS